MERMVYFVENDTGDLFQHGFTFSEADALAAGLSEVSSLTHYERKNTTVTVLGFNSEVYEGETAEEVWERVCENDGYPDCDYSTNIDMVEHDDEYRADLIRVYLRRVIFDPRTKIEEQTKRLENEMSRLDEECGCNPSFDFMDILDALLSENQLHELSVMVAASYALIRAEDFASIVASDVYAEFSLFETAMNSANEFLHDFDVEDF